MPRLQEQGQDVQGEEMKLLKHKKRNLNDGTPMKEEEILEDITFNKFKFNNKQIPSDKNKLLFITCFSEFGVESLALMYCIPLVLKSFPDHYVICVGWHGRDYLYRHLVDEFWAVKEEFQWLREYSQAFRNSSKNLSRLEKSFESMGKLYKSEYMGGFCLGNRCRPCGHFWGESSYGCSCPKCSSKEVDRGLLNDVSQHRKNICRIPRPSQDSINYVQKYLSPRSVGVFARNRVCYGRNLSSAFYTKLVSFLRLKGYNPIWLGERQSTLPCPVSDVTDFSKTKDADNLEFTLALISQLEFTVQFWTASTRFASMVDTPWILFESPDQIVGYGQEGIRIALLSDPDKKKLVLADYKTVLENEELTIDSLDKAIEEIKNNNWANLIGPVQDPGTVKLMLQKQRLWEV